MNKKTLFIALSVAVLLLIAGLLYRSIQIDEPSHPMTFDMPTISNTGVVNTGVVVAGHIETGGMSTGEKTAIDASKIPECKSNLQPVTIIDIDKVVRNCTEKKKEGRTLDGLGGVPPTYMLYNSAVGVMMYDEKSYDGNPRGTLLCKETTLDGEPVYYDRVVSTGKDEYENVPKQELGPMLKASQLGLLNEVKRHRYSDAMYCSEGETGDDVDKDCMDMHSTRATSDTGYYFVAGYREQKDFALLYVINDKVYNPGSTTIGRGDDSKPGQGQRQFVTVKNNIIIVKRMKDEKINLNKKDNNDMNTTTYTLQTCEIPLSK